MLKDTEAEKVEGNEVSPEERVQPGTVDDILLRMTEIEQQNVRLREEVATHRSDMAVLKTAGADAVRQHGEVNKGISEAAIEEFLSTPMLDWYFARHWRHAVKVLPDEQRHDKDLQRTVLVAGVFLEFNRFHGAGSELVDPRDPTGKRPLFEWGYVDLGDLSEVKQGRFKVEEISAALRKVPFFRDGLIFDHAQAVRILTREYGVRRDAMKREREYEAASAALVPGAERAGLDRAVAASSVVDKE